MLLMPIVHGGPAPCLFTNTVADFILYRLQKTKPTVEDVPDADVRAKLQRDKFREHVQAIPTALHII